jgi:hypothetical protein
MTRSIASNPSPGDILELRPKPGVYQRTVVAVDAQSVRYRTSINGTDFGHTTVSLDEWRRELGGEVAPVGQASLFGEATR